MNTLREEQTEFKSLFTELLLVSHGHHSQYGKEELHIVINIYFSTLQKNKITEVWKNKGGYIMTKYSFFCELIL